MQNLLKQLLGTCRDLNGLLKTKDPYHSQVVDRMLNKVEASFDKDGNAIQKLFLSKKSKK